MLIFLANILIPISSRTIVQYPVAAIRPPLQEICGVTWGRIKSFRGSIAQLLPANTAKVVVNPHFPGWTMLRDMSSKSIPAL
jgi:hypothetical protein